MINFRSDCTCSLPQKHEMAFVERRYVTKNVKNKRNDEYYLIILMSSVRKIIKRWSLMQIEKSQSSGQRIIPETRLTSSSSENNDKSRKENPQKLTQLSSRSHPRHLVGKKTAQKDTIIYITSDSQVNCNFPYRWSPASLTFNNYFT